VDVTWLADGEVFTDPAVIVALEGAIEEYVGTQAAFARADEQMGPGMVWGRV
jgi:hypothetical protein